MSKLAKNTKELLKESYAFTKKSTGIDPSKPGSFRELIVNDQSFDTYVNTLAEGLSARDVTGFKLLAENTRMTLLENSMYGINPYETLALPLLRVYFPKTIAKELCTVIPMNKPEIIRGFVKATFKKFGDSKSYVAPSNTDISGGPRVNVPVSQAVEVGTVDILALAGVNAEIAHIEKSFLITAAEVDGEMIPCNVSPSVDGLISATLTNAAGVTDTLTGRINYLTGVLELASVGKKITKVAFSAQLSLEENTINPRVQFSIEKMRLTAKDRQISSEWTIQMQQDVKALFDVDVQSELVSVMGQQIVLDIDREIVNNMLFSCERLNGATHNKTFDINPGSYKSGSAVGYAWGPKQWMENVLPTINKLSAAIYNDTNISTANVIAANPLDATIFESLQEYKFNGSSSDDGDLGYESATVANGKYKILISQVVPQGKMIMTYKPAEDVKAVFVHSPYVPAVLSPYPLGSNPTATILSRYGNMLLRPSGISVLNVIDTGLAG